MQPYVQTALTDLVEMKREAIENGDTELQQLVDGLARDIARAQGFAARFGGGERLGRARAFAGDKPFTYEQLKGFSPEFAFGIRFGYTTRVTVGQ